MSGLYVLITDDRSRIVDVNQEWISFALANWAEDFSPEWVLGERLWRFISDDGTRHLYGMLVKRARETGLEIGFPFRCDSPGMRRFMQMTLQPLEGGHTRWASQLLTEEPRHVALPATPDGPGPALLLRMCSWCLKACVPSWLPLGEGQAEPGTWLELEKLMGGLAQNFEGFYPHVTHGICPDCHERVSDLLKQG
jgi:hypothetical protein